MTVNIKEPQVTFIDEGSAVVNPPALRTPDIQVTWLTGPFDASAEPGLTERLPMQLIDRYLNTAIRRASVEQIEDGTWYAEVAVLPGVWASGETEAAALHELRSVTEDWVLFKIEDHDRDIPVLDTIDLNRL